MNNFSNFTDLATHLTASRNERAVETNAYEGSFIEHSEMAKLTITDAPMSMEMPDPDMARAAVEMVMGTLFDVLRDSRMEEFAQQLAWGFCNSFHMTARQIERREDDTASKLRDLTRHYDPSEIYAVELEETQLLCQTLQGCREAMEAMRDHASAVYRAETGKPFQSLKGSQVSKAGVTASQINARDYLAARASERRQQFMPEGPVVAISGGQQWHDINLIWTRLDEIKQRVPHMVLASTGMSKGVDAIAAEWAAKRNVSLIKFIPNTAHDGKNAGYARNDRIIATRPVEAIVCEGTSTQIHLARKLREAGVPLHTIPSAMQQADTFEHTRPARARA